MAAATWLPIATLMLGFFTSSATTWWTSYLTAKREREIRRDDRKRAAAERQAQFQRETLLALQDAVFELMRGASKVDLENNIAFRAGAKWGAAPVSEPLNTEMGEANRLVSMLVVRVQDDMIRQEVDALRNKVTWIGINLSQQEQKAAVTAAGRHYHKMTTRIGEILRTL